MRPRLICLLLVLVTAAACRKSQKEPKPEKDKELPVCKPAWAREACERDGDPFLCGWLRILDDRTDASLGAAVGLPDAVGDDVLRAAMPDLAGRTFEDGIAPVPAAATFTFKSFAPHVVTFPVDWRADPHNNATWRLELQSLTWIHTFDDDTIAYIVRDWGEHVLEATPPLHWTWDDAGMAKRVNVVSVFLKDYAETRDVLDRGVVRAALRILFTHFYALASDLCYVPQDNHGMMEDVALLKHLRKFPAFTDGQAIWDKTLARAVAHMEASVGDDGMHVEHSPGYQQLYLLLLLSAIDAIEAAGEKPPAAMIETRDAMLVGILHLLQPNLTFPQFGDTENNDSRKVPKQVRLARAETPGDPTILDNLDWVLNRGTIGVMPTERDRVFLEGGYASFRERWDGPDPASPIVGHFTCTHNKLSKAHYHHDETSFELYGHGTELIVDSGKHTYDRTDPLTAYGYGVTAHNVLVVDDATYSPSGGARILDHAIGDDASWVRATPAAYDKLGVDHVRTFAYVRPETFVVLDEIRADAAHHYDQHLHLAPSLDQISVLDDRTVIATASAGGPSLVIASGESPLAIDQIRGQRGEVVQGWWFPQWGQAVANTDLVFRFDRDGDVALPLLITIAAPGAPPIVPKAVAYAVDATTVEVSWTIDGQPRSFRVPRR